MKNEIYFTNDSWKYDARTVNFNNFTISYEQKGGFKTRREAEIAKEKDEKKYADDLKKIKKMANIQYTFKEYVEYWLKNIFLKNTDTCTKTIGVWAVNNLIIPNIKQDILISYVTPDYINDIIKRCIPVCESAGEESLKFMRKILLDAYAYGLIKKDIRQNLIHVNHHVPKIFILNQNQLKKFVMEASKHPGCYFEILLALFAGLRSGEVRGLKYEDFDEDNHTIRISRQYTSNYYLADNNGHFEYTCFMEEKKPKADSSRLLRVPDFFFAELSKKKEFNKEIIKNVKGKGIKNIDEEYISLSPNGNIKRKGTLLSAVKRICNYAGVPVISFHTLRHQFATMLLEKGVPLEEISQLLGHKSTATTFNIYCGVMDADDEARNVINSNFPHR